MTPTQAFVAAIIGSLGLSSAWPYFGPKIVSWFNRKQRELERKEREAGERREKERDRWMRESKEAYSQVKSECRECQAELEAVRKQHAEEIRQIKRELADVKDALLNRIEALDDLIPYITNLSDEKIRELRSANRAHRQAVFRGRI